MRPASSPSTITDPPVGFNSPATTESSVVFPQPLGPTSKVIPPNGTSRSIPRSTRTWLSPAPKFFVTSRHTTAVSSIGLLSVIRPPDMFAYGLPAKDHGRLQHQDAPDAHQARRHHDEQHHRAG